MAGRPLRKIIRSWDCVCKMLKNVTIIIIMMLILIHFIDMSLLSNAVFVILCVIALFGNMQRQ